MIFDPSVVVAPATLNTGLVIHLIPKGSKANMPDGWHITFSSKDRQLQRETRHTSAHAYVPRERSVRLIKVTEYPQPTPDTRKL
jgi:hypothetical protein